MKQRDWALDAMVQLLHENRLVRPIVFDEIVMARLAEEFKISDRYLTLVSDLMDVAAHQFEKAEARSSTDFKAVRKELTQLSMAAKTLENTLSNLSPEGLYALNTLGMRHLGIKSDEPRIIKRSGPTGGASEQTLEFPAKDGDQFLAHALSELEQVLAALSRTSSSAQDAARAGRTGRPEDDAISELLFLTFHTWASILGRAFKLHFDDRSEPLSEAAQFAVRVVKIVDDRVSLPRIANAARKTAKTCKPITSLEELPGNLGDLFKRSS